MKFIFTYVHIYFLVGQCQEISKSQCINVSPVMRFSLFHFWDACSNYIRRRKYQHKNWLNEEKKSATMTI
jgi:hypothetical protein